MLNVTALGADRRSRPRRRVCCRRHDRLRGQTAAARHRAASGGAGGVMAAEHPAPSVQAEVETEVQAELSELDVDAPRVGIVMGSKSDMPTMEKAADGAHGARDPHEVRVMSAHRDPDMVADYAKNARDARPQGDHRRRRPVGRAAGRRRRPHRPAGDRRAADLRDLGRRRARRAARRSPRCRPACRWPASASTTRATPPCWPRASSPPSELSKRRGRPPDGPALPPVAGSTGPGMLAALARSGGPAALRCGPTACSPQAPRAEPPSTSDRARSRSGR